MRALRLAGPGEIDVADVPEPEPADGEVLVQMERAALCATDRKMAQRGVPNPLTPGHEAAGWLADGTFVGIHPDVGCGRLRQCPHCRIGHETRCPDKNPVGVRRDGALAERVTVRADHAVALDGVDPVLAPILEPLACCLHAIAHLDVAAGTPALVAGGGVMGILNTWALQAAGCSVVLVEPDQGRRELAHHLGADVTASPDAVAPDALGARPRVAVVTVPSGAALTSALEQVEVGGVVHAFASVPGGADVDINLVHNRHLRLVGTTGSDLADYERARALVISRRVPLHQLPIEEIGLGDVPGRLRGGGPKEVLKNVVDLKGA